MKKKALRQNVGKNLPNPADKARLAAICLATWLASVFVAMASPPGTKPASTYPQAYSVERDEAAGILSLRTPYYTVEHDLRKGGAISRITLRNGRTANLLVRPVETRVRDEEGTELTDLKDRAPRVMHRRSGPNEIVAVESVLVDPAGRASDLRVKTTYEYRWGYIKIHKEFVVPEAGFRLTEVCPFSTVLAPSLTDYGYREGITEEEGAPEFSFGSNIWGRLRLDQPSDPSLETPYVPRSMIFVDPGIEGLEWFVGSDLAQWELRLAGRRGRGRCLFERSRNPAGLALAISPLWTKSEPLLLKDGCAFDYYLAFPILEGHAHRPWIHTSFNRNRGKWVSTEEIRRWAEQATRPSTATTTAIIMTTACSGGTALILPTPIWRNTIGSSRIAGASASGQRHTFQTRSSTRAPTSSRNTAKNGAGWIAGETSDIIFIARRASSAPRCACAPAGSIS